MNDINEIKAFRASEEDLSTAVKDEYGVLYSKDGKCLLKCENRALTEYSVKEGTEVICNGAFSTCEALTIVKMPPRGVVTIGMDAFHFCTALQEINIPITVTSIGEYAFAECYKLKSIILPQGLTKINEYLFSNCVALECVNIPKSVTFIDEGVFMGCSSLKSIEVEPLVLPTVGDKDLFEDVNKDECELLVPEPAEKAYAEAEVWKDFSNRIIVE